MKENQGETLKLDDELSRKQEIEDIRQKLKTFFSVDRKIEFIRTIENPSFRIELLLEEQIQNAAKDIIINDINLLDYTELLELLKRLNDPNKVYVGVNIRDNEKKLQCLEAFSEAEWIKVAATLPEEIKISLLDKLDDTRKVRLIFTISDPELKQNSLDRLENKEHAQILKRLYKKNNKVGEKIDLRILDKQYLETLGEDKINILACFEYEQEYLLKLNPKEYTIFVKCLNSYMAQNGKDEWNDGVEKLIRTIRDKEDISKLIEKIENIEDVNIENLVKIILEGNPWGLKTVEEVNNYQEVVRKKSDSIVRYHTMMRVMGSPQMKKAIFQKAFGSTDIFLKKYRDCIEFLDDEDVKDVFYIIEEIKKINDPKILAQIYNECEEVQDLGCIERRAQRAFTRLYNEGLYGIKDKEALDINEEISKLDTEILRIQENGEKGELDRLENKKETFKKLESLGINIHDAGTDFKMIVTSVSPYVSGNFRKDNYEKDWNRSEVGVQHLCSCYIRSDMLGIPKINHLCYGFSEMAEDSLEMIGAHDMGSNQEKKLTSIGSENEYVTPDELINTTTNDTRGLNDYNELDFKRFQNGEKKQPDYIVAFMVNGVIDNLDRIEQAVNDWGQQLPIVIIDVDDCLEAQKKQLAEMYGQFNESKSPQIARKIIQKERNNRVTTKRFRGSLSQEKITVNEEIKKWLEEHEQEKTERHEVDMNQLRENNEGVTAQERKEGISVIRKLRDRIQEIVNEKEGEGIEI